jgi:hypothetical protein
LPQVASEAQLSENDVSSLRSQLEVFDSDFAVLRQAFVQFLTDRIGILERQDRTAMSMLWKTVGALKGAATDARFSNLDAYRALTQVDSQSFVVAIQRSLGALKAAKFPNEAELSPRLLIQDAKSNLHKLRDLQALLRNTFDSSRQMNDDIVARISERLGGQAVPDERMLLLLSQVTEKYPGGPGSDLNLRADLSDLIDETYRELLGAVEKTSQ